jgi:heme oxygenase
LGSKAVSLADTLREQTKDAHTRAEKHPQQARLVKGEATREDYAAWLGQMAQVWRALDRGLATKAATDPRISAITRPYHAHAARVEADLTYLGSPIETHAELPATAAFVAKVNMAAAGVGPELVGIWYVLEGSANGGKYIARAISKSLGIAGPEGLMSLDPHGDAQRERWQAWRADVDAQPWTEGERASIVSAATETFNSIHSLLDDLEVTPSTR